MEFYTIRYNLKRQTVTKKVKCQCGYISESEDLDKVNFLEHYQNIEKLNL